MIEEVLLILLLFFGVQGSWSYSSCLLISTVDSGGLWVLPDVVDVVPVLVVSLVEGSSVLKELNECQRVKVRFTSRKMFSAAMFFRTWAHPGCQKYQKPAWPGLNPETSV